MPIIIDNSVIIKWFIPEENESQEALELLRQIKHGTLIPIIPILQKYEFFNVIAKYISRKILLPTDGTKVLSKFERLAHKYFHYDDADFKGKDILELTSRYHLSAYDGSYVLLALENKTTVYTTDKSLISNTKQLGDTVKPLSAFF